MVVMLVESMADQSVDVKVEKMVEMMAEKSDDKRVER